MTVLIHTCGGVRIVRESGGTFPSRVLDHYLRRGCFVRVEVPEWVRAELKRCECGKEEK